LKLDFHDEFCKFSQRFDVFSYDVTAAGTRLVEDFSRLLSTT